MCSSGQLEVLTETESCTNLAGNHHVPLVFGVTRYQVGKPLYKG